MDARDWVAIAFFALVAIGYKLGLHRKIAEMLDERRFLIAEELERVRALRVQAEAALNAARTQMAEAEREADRVVRAAHEAAERVKVQAEDMLRRSRERHLRAAEERIRLAVEEAVVDLRVTLTDAALRQINAQRYTDPALLHAAAEAALTRSAAVLEERADS